MWFVKLVLLIGITTTSTTYGWMTGSSVSSFGGSVLLLERPSSSMRTATSASEITMKKGKENVPPSMRTQYARQKELVAMREQMLASSRPGPDGLPVFNLFVRTKRANVWYPCGSFKGDERSGALAKSYADDGMLAGISKKQIDNGIASSLYRDQEKLKDSICRAYPQLRKSRDEFEYGYKLAYIGLSKEKADDIKVIEPKESKGLIDNIKGLFS